MVGEESDSEHPHFAPYYESSLGTLVETRDSRAIAQAIITILKDPDLKQKMSGKARSEAYTEFSWPRAAEMHRDAKVAHG